MLAHDQIHDMLPIYRLAQYHKDMAEVARALRDNASENYHKNESDRLLRECMAAGGFLREP